ncbi:MAG: hypothetical protein ACKV2V_01490 [Blastocatellia bacterium]
MISPAGKQREERKVLDEHLQKLIRELGEAINHAVNESDDVNECLVRIRDTGHDVFLVLEATIAFSERRTSAETHAPAEMTLTIEDRLKQISREDKRFLQSLNIRFDSEDG